MAEYRFSPSCVHIPGLSMCLLCLCNGIKVAQRVYYRYPISSWNTNKYRKKSMVNTFCQKILTRLKRELKVFCMMLQVFRCASISCHSYNASNSCNASHESMQVMQLMQARQAHLWVNFRVDMSSRINGEWPHHCNVNILVTKSF